MKRSLIISAVLIILFFSCKNKPKDTAGSTVENTRATIKDSMVLLTSEQFNNSGLTTGMPEKREMHTTLKVNGVIDVPPQNIVSISIPLGGYLKKMDLIPGSKVSKGAILATIEDVSYIQLQQDYLTAKSRLLYDEADFIRQKELNETKSTSDKVFQQAKTDFESEKILVRSLSEKLKLVGIVPGSLNEGNISRSINVHAPISGYVTKVNVNIGKYVNPSDVLFELTNPDDLHVRLTVFENDAGSLAVGQKITCTTNNNQDEKYMATVHLITPAIGDDRATEVHCHLDNHKVKFFPGTFVNASIQLNNAEVMAVPEEAVVKWENKYYIFSVEPGNQFRMLPVETGRSDNGFIEIKSLLPPGNIVTRNAYTLLMKMKNSGEEG